MTRGLTLWSLEWSIYFHLKGREIGGTTSSGEASKEGERATPLSETKRKRGPKLQKNEWKSVGSLYSLAERRSDTWPS